LHDPDGHGFLTVVEVQKPPDFCGTVELGRFLFEASNAQHLV
jgi:hypothetical protein